MLLNRSISSGVITGVSRVSNDGMRVRVWKDGVCVTVTEVSEDDVYVVLCSVAGTCEDGKCVVLWCMTEVLEDGVCVALCGVAGTCEDG